MPLVLPCMTHSRPESRQGIRGAFSHILSGEPRRGLQSSRGVTDWIGVDVEKATCLSPDCDVPAKCRGLCSKHYGAHRQAGSLSDVALPSRAIRRELSDIDVEARTCVCEIHGKTRLRIRVRRVGRRPTYSCRACDRVPSKKGRSKKSYPATPEQRRRALLRSYGLTEGDVAAMMDEQRGSCAICYRGLDEYHCIDHCHDTGRVRGLLCRSCNVALGHFKDDPERLLRAVAYLGKV